MKKLGPTRFFPLHDATKGFTLVELMVCLAVIGLLLGLLLPAVLSAREAARRTDCSNRLRQLVLANHEYELLHRVYPVGNEGSDSKMPYQNWPAKWLPFLEQSPMAIEIEESYQRSPDPFDPARHRLVSQPVAAFDCPSDGRASAMQYSRGGLVA